MTQQNDEIKVVRFIGKNPHGWISRGDLLRVVQDGLPSGKVRVVRAHGKTGGAPQYVRADEIEPVGTFDSDGMFGTGASSQDADGGDEEAAVCADRHEAEAGAGTLTVEVATPDRGAVPDVRQMVRDEVAAALHDAVKAMVREELDAILGPAE